MIATRRGIPSVALCTMLAIIVIGLPDSTAVAQTRLGITGGAGAGLFIAADDDYYMDLPADLYPEIGLQLDASVIRLGLKFALIYRKREVWVWAGEEYHEEYTRAFIPVQAEFLLAPLNTTSKGSGVSPYAGVMAGVFVPVGDNDDTLTAFSVKVGGEADLDPVILYGDVRYTWAKDHGYDAGGLIIVAGVGIRLNLAGS